MLYRMVLPLLSGLMIKKKYENGSVSGWGYEDVSEERAEKLKNIALKYHIRFSVHASCSASPFSAEGIRDIETAFEIAEGISAKLVNIHLVTTEGMANFCPGN